MQNFMTLYKAELRKILSKRAVWIMFVIGMVFFGTVELSNLLFEKYNYDDEVVTGAEFEALQREKGESITGRVMDDSFYSDVRKDIIQYKEAHEEAAEKYSEKNMEEYPWIWYCVDRTGHEWLFNKEIRSLGGLKYLRVFMEGTAEEIQAAKKTRLVSTMNDDGITEGEQAYWLEKYNKAEEGFKYSFAEGYGIFYDSLMFMTCFVLLVIVVGVAGVFADESIFRTDVIILSSKKGRKDICHAKLLAGCTFSILMMILIETLCLMIPLFAWGSAGWNTPIQNVIIGAAYDMTIGQAVIMTYGLSILAALLCGLFTMFLSYAFKNTLPVMALQASLSILAFINIPYKLGLISKLWNLRPTGVLRGAGFAEYRLFSAPGGYLNCFEMASLVYVVLGVILVVLTLNGYRRMQVTGR